MKKRKHTSVMFQFLRYKSRLDFWVGLDDQWLTDFDDGMRQ